MCVCVRVFVCVVSNLSIFDGEQLSLEQRKSFPKGLVKNNIAQMDALFVGKIFAGVGVQFTKKEGEKKLTVSAIAPGSPADGGGNPKKQKKAAGHLEIGDEVKKVGQIPVHQGVSADRAYVFTLGEEDSECQVEVRRVNEQGVAKKVTVKLSRKTGFENWAEFTPHDEHDTVAMAASAALQFYFNASGAKVVKDVLPYSPAAQSGEVFRIKDDDLDGLSAEDAAKYLKGADGSTVKITPSDRQGAVHSNLRQVVLQRRVPEENGTFRAPVADLSHRAGSAARERERARARSTTGEDVEDPVVRLVLDGNFHQLLAGDAAAQKIYSIKLCDDVSQCLGVPANRVSVKSLQHGSILADIRFSPPASDASEIVTVSVRDGTVIASAGTVLDNRSADDVAAELIAQANQEGSPLRLRRLDLRGAETDGATGVTPLSEILLRRGQTGASLMSEPGNGSREELRPTLSSALMARPRTGTEDADDEDDGIPLDFPKSAVDMPRARQRGSGVRPASQRDDKTSAASQRDDESSDDESSEASDDLDPVELVTMKLKKMLDADYLPETRLCCAVTHEQFTLASISGDTVPSPPDSGDEEEDADEETRRIKNEEREQADAVRAAIKRGADRPGEFVVVPAWGIIISPWGLDFLRSHDVVGLYAVDAVDPVWTRHVSSTGLVVNEQPLMEDDEGEEGSEEPDAVMTGDDVDNESAEADAEELAKKLSKLICAAVCADMRVPKEKLKAEEPPDVSQIKDENEAKLLLMKWQLAQKTRMLSAIEAEVVKPRADGTFAKEPFEPGPMCFRCARWMRTDKDVLKCGGSCRQGALLVAPHFP